MNGKEDVVHTQYYAVIKKMNKTLSMDGHRDCHTK